MTSNHDNAVIIYTVICVLVLAICVKGTSLGDSYEQRSTTTTQMTVAKINCWEIFAHIKPYCRFITYTCHSLYSHTHTHKHTHTHSHTHTHTHTHTHSHTHTHTHTYYSVTLLLVCLCRATLPRDGLLWL